MEGGFHDHHDWSLRMAGRFHDPHDLAPRMEGGFHDPHDWVPRIAASFHYFCRGNTENYSVFPRLIILLSVLVCNQSD
jgi:hypothetical protein